METDAVIGQIIAEEWDMFQAVNEGAEQAPCQQDRDAFERMRRAQFDTWSQAACASYLDDLHAAKADGRNLLEEKYLRMMASTEPETLAKLGAELEPLPADRAAAVDRIAAAMLGQFVQVNKEFPYLALYARPSGSDRDDEYDTSFETYTKGELATYSLSTLEELERCVAEMGEDGSTFARRSLLNTVRAQGFESLEEAEAEAERRVAEVRVGCCCGGC